MNPATAEARKVRLNAKAHSMPTSSKVLIAIPVLFILLWAGSIFYHEYAVSPTGVETIQDFYRRFGDPPIAARLKTGTGTYFLIIGDISAPLAFPAGPPEYVFDTFGNLVDWTPEVRKDADFIQRWQPDSGERIGTTQFLQHFPPR